MSQVTNGRNVKEIEGEEIVAYSSTAIAESAHAGRKAEDLDATLLAKVTAALDGAGFVGGSKVYPDLATAHKSKAARLIGKYVATIADGRNLGVGRRFTVTGSWAFVLQPKRVRKPKDTATAE